jgi:hypothetical protein
MVCVMLGVRAASRGVEGVVWVVRVLFTSIATIPRFDRFNHVASFAQSGFWILLLDILEVYGGSQRLTNGGYHGT